MGAGKGYFTDYPKHVGFILGNEFCERFSFYGMKAILVIFLTRALKLSDDKSTEIYHGFNMACYFTPLFGAVLADGYLGQYKTIFSISIVYAIGNVIMAVGAVPLNGQEYIRALPFVGLALIAVGTGGIKPCVAAFGADQFEDHQTRQKETFFSMFYMAINIGSLLSMIITPIIRSEVVCFGDECYALAFGIPAILMIVSLVLFLIGTRWYKIIPPGENVIGKLFHCIFIAFKGKCSCGSEEKREHWLEYADSKYDKRFISDVKAVMHVLFVFLPFPMFNALFDQQGSRWTLQAEQMDGDFGSFVIEPDLIQVANPILVVILVPLTETFIFPCMNKLKIPNSPLQRMGIGMFLAGTAFIVSAMLQIAIDKALPSPIPNGSARFKVINAIPCDISGSILNPNFANHTFSIPYSERTTYLQSFDVPNGNYTFKVTFEKCAGSVKQVPSSEDTFSMENQGSYNMIAFWNVKAQVGKEAQLIQVKQPLITQTEQGNSRFQFYNTWDEFQYVKVKTIKTPTNASRLELSEAVEVPHGKVEVTVEDSTFEAISKAGAVYTLVFHYSSLKDPQNAVMATQYQDISPNSVNILLMLPQYLVMTFGEVFFLITGLSFAYSQSPPTMKAVLQAAWLLTSSIGNLIVMVITAIGSLPSQIAEFFLYAGLMYLTTIIYGFMAMSYKYVNFSEENEELEDDPAHNEGGVDNLAISADEIPPKYENITQEDGPYTSVHL